MLSCVYYGIQKKTQPIMPVMQFNHIRRFLKDFFKIEIKDEDDFLLDSVTNTDENVWVSPFVFNEKNGINISRITTTDEHHALLQKTGDIIPLSTPVFIKTFSEWKKDGGILQNNFLEISFLTPITIRYQDRRIYYKNPVSLFDIFWNLRTSVPQKYFDTDFSVLNGAPTKFLMNLGFFSGTLSFLPLYDRGQTKISGVVGHVVANVDDLFKSKQIQEIISYFMYLLNYFPVGFRQLSLAYSYRPDIVPIPELSTKEYQYGISIHPSNLYAVMYELRSIP